MPDISMCNGGECPLKETCYRFKATPNTHQAYSGFYEGSEKECKYYWKIEEDEQNQD